MVEQQALEIHARLLCSSASDWEEEKCPTRLRPQMRTTITVTERSRLTERTIPVNRLIDDRGGIDSDSINRGVGNLVDNHIDGVFLHIPSPLSPLSSGAFQGDGGAFQGGVYYLDREHSDEGLGVFQLLQLEMKTDNMELWVNTKISSGFPSMATSTSEGGVLQDLVVEKSSKKQRLSRVVSDEPEEDMPLLPPPHTIWHSHVE